MSDGFESDTNSPAPESHAINHIALRVSSVDLKLIMYIGISRPSLISVHKSEIWPDISSPRPMVNDHGRPGEHQHLLTNATWPQVYS